MAQALIAPARRGGCWSSLHETESFPAGSNDDQVDAMAQALARLSEAGPRIRALTYPNVRGSILRVLALPLNLSNGTF
jgi:hypothetical protein